MSLGVHRDGSWWEYSLTPWSRSPWSSTASLRPSMHSFFCNCCQSDSCLHTGVDGPCTPTGLRDGLDRRLAFGSMVSLGAALPAGLAVVCALAFGTGCGRYMPSPRSCLKGLRHQCKPFAWVALQFNGVPNASGFVCLSVKHTHAGWMQASRSRKDCGPVAFSALSVDASLQRDFGEGDKMPVVEVEPMGSPTAKLLELQTGPSDQAPRCSG